MELSHPFYIDKREGNAHIDICGVWDFTYTDDAVEDISSITYNMQATLPESTYLNLYNAGVLPDPYFSDNSHQYTWVDSKVWYYKKNFSIDHVIDSETTDAFLCFDGLGYYSRVWLNGELLGEHEGMFGGPVVNVADRLICGNNELVVEVKAFNYYLEGDRRFWRGYVSTGWQNRITEIIPWNIARDEETTNGDFNTFGIWKEIRLEILPKTHIARPYLYTKSLDGNNAQLELELSIATDKFKELDTILSAPDWNYTFSYANGLTGALSDDTVNIGVSLTDNDTGEVIYDVCEDYTLYDYEKNGVAEKFRECQFYNRTINLENITPWYPLGLGEPKLYGVEITISRNGVKLDTLKFNTGIRIIEQFESTGRKYRQRWEKYWFSVNGKRMFLKAMNWTPIDFLYRIDNEEYDWALEEIKNCGIQLIRVWSGGGMPEVDYFYDLCDRLGIMVWQDNFIANQTAPKWKEKILEDQVCYNLFRIRNHPSLAVHCGGNEFSCYNAGNSNSMFVIKRNIEDLDPSRKFYRASPDGGSYHGYRNMDSSWLRKLFKELPFMAESGTHSAPNYKSLRQNLLENEWHQKLDITSDDFVERFPGFHNRLCEYKRDKCLRMRSRASHYINLNDATLKEFSEGINLSACEYYQFLIQSLRENYPKTVGVVPWVFKRNWTTVGVQLVDGMGEPVACYYAVKNAYTPKIVFAALENVIYAPGEEFTVPVKVINENEVEICGRVELEVYDEHLVKLYTTDKQFSMSADSYMETVFTPTVKLDSDIRDRHFYIRVNMYEKGIRTSTSFYTLMCLARMAEKDALDYYRAEPRECINFENGPFVYDEIGATSANLGVKVIDKHQSGNRITLKVEVTADAAAYPVMMEVAEDSTLSYQSDNYFFIDKGETRVIDMEIRNKGDLSRQLTLSVSSWNAKTVQVKI